MANVAENLAAAGFELPAPPAALGMYVPAVRSGLFVFTSGQLPLRSGALITSGVVGAGVSLETAQECARQCALNALAAAATAAPLDMVVRAVKLVGYVSSAPGFSQQPAVVNGASEVLSAAFGEAGVHAREAVGVAALPMNAPVEVSIVLELAE